MLLPMALTDGTYIARLKLHHLDQVYLPGASVPGSAFQDDNQVIEYVRRGWVDVDSAEKMGGGGRSGILVAHTRSDQIWKDSADLICDGADDHVEIQEALDEIGNYYGAVYLAPAKNYAYMLGDSVNIWGSQRLIGVDPGVFFYPHMDGDGLNGISFPKNEPMFNQSGYKSHISNLHIMTGGVAQGLNQSGSDQLAENLYIDISEAFGTTSLWDAATPTPLALDLGSGGPYRSTIRNVYVTAGNWRDPDNPAVRIHQDSQNSLLENVMVYGVPGAAFFVDGKKTTLRNCTTEFAGRKADNTYDQFVVGANAKSTVLEGCRSSAATFGEKARYAITVTAGASRTLIANCHLHDGTAYGTGVINDAGTGTVLNGNITT